jgi:hypothetical protein
MPEGLAREIRPESMQDLLAFLGAGGVQATYTYPGPGAPSPLYPDDPSKPKLTDRNVGGNRFDDGNWVGFFHRAGVSEHRIDFDLGQAATVHAVQIHYGVNHRPGIVHAPSRMTISLGDDGQTYGREVVAKNFDDSADGLGAYQVSRRVLTIPLGEPVARYVRIAFTNEAEWTLLSEVTFNPPAAAASKPTGDKPGSK